MAGRRPSSLQPAGAATDLRSVTSDRLITSLRAAVAATPDDVELRLHLAQLLDAAGRRDEAVQQAAAVLQREPANSEALRLVTGSPVPAERPAAHAGGERPIADEELLRRLDEEMSELVPPMFSDQADAPFAMERTELRLRDVGGMSEVKARLEASLLAPLRNPELGRLYRKSTRGGLLLYGPPGCGKTYIARAVAGEMGAHFIPVSLADVLDMYVGNSERNVHALFQYARAHAPCVVFLDEVDALGQKRSQQRGSAARGSVNQLLTEMDGVAADNTGVFVLGATNHPWDVDIALRRPGRFDRMVLVLPPDEEARRAVLRHHLEGRPIEGVDVAALAARTDGYSGADLAYVCEVAAERALMDSARTGSVRMIGMPDLLGAVAEVRPSTGAWFETARNVVEFANEDGAYDELAGFMRKRRSW
jgi:SpoVK/Ycf46/Vps4 family AAA+-type ATPase